MTELAHDLRVADNGPSRDVIRIQFWSLAFSPDDPPVSVKPQQTKIRQLSDGRTVLETRALPAHDANGNSIEDPTAWKAGEVLFEHTFAPGEAIGVFPRPSSGNDWGALLRDGGSLEADAGTAAYFRAVSDLLNEHALSLEEQSSLVLFLAKLPGVRVDGHTTDRLGRDGVSFSAEESDQRHTLVISGSRGILSYELIYVGSERTDLSAPAVIDYQAWF